MKTISQVLKSRTQICVVFGPVFFLAIILASPALVFAQNENHYYYSASITGPTSICADNSTIHTYTGSGGESDLIWSLIGGTFVGGNQGFQVTVKWSSYTGSISASAMDSDCWTDYEQSPPVNYCDYYHYDGTLNVTGKVIPYQVDAGPGSITLNGSQSNFTYQLILDSNGSNVGAPKTGTGTSLTWIPIPNGAYRIMGTKPQNECTAPMNNVATVTVNPYPELNLSGTRYLANGQTITLSTGSFYQIQWMKDNVDISGATGTSIVITQPGGVYKVKTKMSSVSAWYTSLTSLTVLSPMSQSVNLVSATRVLKSGVTDQTSLQTLLPSELSQSFSYSDGFGRTFQSVAVAQSPTGRDIVSVQAFGRQGLVDTTFLPYTIATDGGRLRTTAIRTTASGESYAWSEQYTFYQSVPNQPNPKVELSTYPYGRTVYSLDPGMRGVEQSAPGESWALENGRTAKDSLVLNSASLPVRYWKSDGTTSENYPNGTVAIAISTDENANRVRTYSNPMGQVILKQVEADTSTWLETYYIYDNYGRLIFELPPKAVTTLGTGTSVNDPRIAKLIFRYKYDGRGRLISKKVPGAAPQEIVYDIFDRVVLTRDSSLRVQGKWFFTKYDYNGRVVASGLYKNSKSHKRVQNWLNQAYTSGSSLYPPANYAELKSNAGGSMHGYTNQSFPKGADPDSIQYLSVNYFDNYDFDASGTADYTYLAGHLDLAEPAASTATRGLTTGSKRVTLNTAGNPTATWLYSVVFYGSYDRPIQTLSNSHLHTTMADVTTMAYDFTGKVIKSKTTHNGSSTSKQVIISRPEYDTYAGRLLRQYQTMNNPSEWSSAVGVTISGSTVTKNSGTTGWDAGAFSLNRIEPNTNGALEFKVSSTTGAKMMGLSDTNPNVSYTAIDYGIYPKNGGTTVEIWENNVLKGTYSGGQHNFTPSDVFRIERSGTTILYSKNGGAPFHTTLNASTAGLYADCSIHANGQAFVDVTFVGQEKLLVQYEYNELGQLVDKKLHDTGGSVFLQSVDYRYNIRGWLKSINNAQLTNDGVLNDETTDAFGEEIVYASVESGIGNTPLFNGNISATKWKMLGTTGLADQRSYKYTYDKSDRLTSAVFKAHTGTGWTKEAGTLDETVSYDPNGNILTLQRKRNLRGITGGYPPSITSTAELIDNLTYTYASVGSGTQNSNSLLKVEDAASGTAGSLGFVNGESLPTEYKYNADGAMTMDENKAIDSIHYNIFGTVRRVKFTSGDVIVYTYDATGTKLRMAVTKAGNTVTTDYVGGFVYENGVISFFSSPEGRVARNGGVYEYQYSIADHVGNTRALVTSVTPSPLNITATFEGNASDNANQFTNVNAANVLTKTVANNTPGGTKTIRLNQTYRVGPGKSIKVYPGDKVDAEVWCYFESQTGFGTSSPTVATMVTAVAAAFGGASGGGGESQKIYDGVNSALGAFGLGGNQGNARPAAYLNYILYDQNYKVLDMGWTLVPTSAYTSKQKITLPQISVKEAGYYFTYLSYENLSNTYVWFDDYKVVHTKSNVIQANEYYAFGLQTANSWTRENTVDNRYLANGSTELNKTTNLYDLEFRNYDPALGRMTQVDPMATKFSSLTPYNYSFNNPVSFVDVNGATPVVYSTEQYNELQDPIYEQYVDKIYMSSSGTWVNDDVIRYRLIGWSAPTARYAGSAIAFLMGGLVSWQSETFAGMGWTDVRNMGGGWTATIGDITINYNSLDAGMTSITGFSSSTPTVSHLSMAQINAQYDDYLTSVNIANAEKNSVGPELGQRPDGTFVDLTGKRDMSSRMHEFLGTNTGGSGRISTGNYIKDAIYSGQNFVANDPRGALILQLPTFAMGGAFAALGRLANLGRIGATGSKVAGGGGLNLFKYGSQQASKSTGWKIGDRFLYLSNQGSPKLNWAQNSGFLRAEMKFGKPIFDSYRYPNGNLIPTRGFLNAERSLLQNRGWTYNPSLGAWMPPGL